MPDRDFAIGTVGIPQVGQMSLKPRYLISLTDPTTKSKTLSYFIALDKPGFEPGFITCKGFYSVLSEDDIVVQFGELVSNTPKEAIQELLLPTHRVHCIRSLVFNANKPANLPNR